MALNHLQLILTNQTLQEDAEAVTDSPAAALTVAQIEIILHAARAVESVDTIHFIGGEPFLHYPALVQGVKAAAAQGYHTIIATNAFWATSVENALLWLEPFRDVLGELRLRGVVPHHHNLSENRVEIACSAAEQIGIRVGKISLSIPHPRFRPLHHHPDILVGQAQLQPWHSFKTCPYRDLNDPEYLSIDPFGNVHICEGVVIGNIFQNSLQAIWDTYIPQLHPIASVLLRGGPAALVAYYGLEDNTLYEDACELCRAARKLISQIAF